MIALVLGGPALRGVLHHRGRDEFAADLRLVTWPLRLLAAAALTRIALRFFAPDAWSETLDWALPVLALLAIAAAAWVVVRSMQVIERVIFRRLRIDVADNLRARSRRTQIQLVKRVADVFVWTTAVVVGLFTLEPVREMGPGLVAYAGIIGVVLGLALRAPLENLIAGLIVAATEPVRIDDVVVVEGEWGNVEEIALSHVVVKLWDERRLVVPTSYFLSQPFQNWTRHGAAVVGTVIVRADHGVDVERVRAEFERLVARSPHWDGRVRVLQVTGHDVQGVELRGLMSARNAGSSWDLRCEVREQLMACIQQQDAVPRARLQDVTDSRWSDPVPSEAEMPSDPGRTPTVRLHPEEYAQNPSGA